MTPIPLLPEGIIVDMFNETECHVNVLASWLAIFDKLKGQQVIGFYPGYVEQKELLRVQTL
jgi:hypothetical protein